MTDRTRFHVFVNEHAGSVDELDEELQRITSAFAEAAVDAVVEAVDPDRLADAMQRAWNREGEGGGDRVDAVVVAGGDGTINCAARTAVDGDMTLGVLPMGTFNHFAKDLGMPDDLAEAAAWLAAATPSRVDVGEVNGRIFVNNASIGVYPHMVQLRDRIRERHGWGKIRAVPVAVAATLHRLPLQQLRLHVDEQPPIDRTTPFLFVGNGTFDDEGRKVGERTSITEGRLGVYVTTTRSRWRLVTDAIRSRVRGVHAAPSTERFVAKTLSVSVVSSTTVTIALDGEPTEMESPLEFTSRPAALCVLRRD